MSDSAAPFDWPVVDLPPEVASPEAAVRFLLAHLVAGGKLPESHADDLLGRVLRREALGATAMGQGLAIPHCRSDAVREVVGIVGRAAEPFAWPGAVDGEPVRMVCLLIGPAPGPSARADRTDGDRLLEALRRLLEE
jgi:2-O-A-mannosyl-D-glycerate PTS system EIIABC component